MIKSTSKAGKKHSLLLAVCLSLLISGWALTARAEIKVEGFLWMLTADTDALADFQTGLDNLREFGADIEEDETIPGFRITVGKTHQLSLSAFTVDVSGDPGLRPNLGAFGLPVDFLQEFSSDFEATFTRAEYRYNLEGPLLSGGLVAGAQFIDIDTALGLRGVGRVGADNQSLLPFVGFHAEATPLPLLRLQALGAFAVFDVDDTVTQFADVEISANLHPLPFVFLGAGYRHIAIEADPDSPIEYDLTLSGPVLYGGFEF